MTVLAKPTENYSDLPGLRFHYFDWGGTGTPIILIHGLASTAHMWDLVAPHLSDLGHVVALDQRGHGLTSQPSSGYDFDTVTNDLANFSRDWGFTEKFFLVGHSWGGHVALHFARKHSERLKGIVLVDGGIMDLKTRWPTWEIAEEHMTPPNLDGKTLIEIRKMIKEEWLGDAWTPQTGEMALQVFETYENNLVRPRLRRANHMQIARAIWEFTPSQYFAHIKCPSLLVFPVPFGMWQEPDDWQVDRRKQVENAEKSIRNCKVIWFQNTIHDVPWHRPEMLVEVLANFIKAN